MNDATRLEDLFHTARNLPEGTERLAYLDGACGADSALRLQVDHLLAADLRASNCFGGAAPTDAAAADAVHLAAEELSLYRKGNRSSRESRVLEQLEAQSGHSLRVHVDSSDQEGAPVKVTAESRELRDPSGRYQALGEIGHGGVGVVYKGRDHDLGRDVAIKILRDDYTRRPEMLSRFVEEAQISGQLQHPGIVPVYELGLHAGERPFIAMKLIKGESLAFQLKSRGAGPSERQRLIGIFEQICQTMAYAHSRNVIHRDLKPANVMIGAFGEVQIVDWGFAKVFKRGLEPDEGESPAAISSKCLSQIETLRSGSGSGSHSTPGSMMGTPAYMPPEQARGEVESLDSRSDVFGLGAILCEILTGQPPYAKADGSQIQQAATANLARAQVRLKECGADPQLVSLCLQCLAPAQAARPSSAGEVAERIGEYQRAVEERAQQADLRAVEAHYRQRNTLMASVGTVLLLILGTSGWLWSSAGARERADQATDRVARARDDASGAHGQALASGLDPRRWDAAVSSARNVVALCEDPVVGAETRRSAVAQLTLMEAQARAAHAEADRLARDDAMLERLVRVRIPTDDDLRDGADLSEQRRLDAGYADAFASYLPGVDLFHDSIGQALDSLQEGEIERELAADLDHWALIRDTLHGSLGGLDQRQTDRLRALAGELGPEGEWRGELRRLLPSAQVEGASLTALASRANLAELDASDFRVLSAALWRAGETQQAVEILRQARHRHPQDFDLCFQLALRLELLPAPRAEESLGVYRIANALRPELDEVLHRQALILEGLGRPEEADAIYRTLIERDPERAHWHFHLGDSLRDKGDVEGARRSYERGIEQQPLVYDSWGNLIFLLSTNGDLEGATAWGYRAMEYHSGEAKLHNTLATITGNLGRHEEALEHARVALDLDPPAAHYGLAVVQGALGDTEAAIVNYGRSIETDPSWWPAYHNLGLTYRDLARLEEWTAHGALVVEAHPDRAEAHAYFGNALLGAGRHEQAVEELRTAVSMAPDSAPFHEILGYAYKAQGKYSMARQALARASEIDPESATLHTGLAEILNLLDRHREALEHFQRALELDPALDGIHESLGLTFLLQGEKSDAKACFEEALVLDPDSTVALLYLGQLLFDEGDFERAASLFQHALQVDPGLAEAWRSLGALSSRQGRMDEALEHWKQAVELDPSNVPAQLDLAWALTERGDEEAAIEHFSAAIECEPENGQTYNSLGLALRSVGRYEEAVEAYRDAIEHWSEPAPGYFNLAFSLAQLDRNEEAILNFESALEIWEPREDDFSVLWAGRTRERLGPLYYNLAERDRTSERREAALAGFRRAIEMWSPARSPHQVRWSVRALTYEGLLLFKRGETEAAIRSYRRALELDPDVAVTLFNLGEALQAEVRLDEAIEAFGKALDLWAPSQSAFAIRWARRSETQIRTCELQRDASPVLRGEREPASSLELQAAVQVGFYQGRHHEVLALGKAAVTRDVELDEGISPRTSYDCARAAARLAGNEGSRLLELERTQLREVCRTWLHRTATASRRDLDSEERADEARDRLSQALRENDFAFVRGAAIEDLPGEEQQAWSELWTAIEEDVRSGP